MNCRVKCSLACAAVYTKSTIEVLELTFVLLKCDISGFVTIFSSKAAL